MSHYGYYGRVDYLCEEEKKPSLTEIIFNTILDLSGFVRSK